MTGSDAEIIGCEHTADEKLILCQESHILGSGLESKIKKAGRGHGHFTPDGFASSLS